MFVVLLLNLDMWSLVYMVLSVFIKYNCDNVLVVRCSLWISPFAIVSIN